MRTYKAIEKILSAAAAAALAASLSGCMFDASIEGLLSPPKLTEAQTAIYNALILNTGNQIELVYPRTGEYLSPFVLYDLDGSPSGSSADEAIVFYRETSPQSQNESSLRINILDQQNGEWVSVGDRPLSGVNIENVSFHSFFGSDRPDNILVSCSGLGQTENSMYVLEYTGDGFREHFSGRYSIMEIINAADGSSPKLFWIGRDSATNVNKAYLGGVRDRNAAAAAADPEENAEPVFESFAADFTPGEASIQRIVRQRLSDSNSLIFLDYSTGDNTYGSLVFSCFLNNLYLVCLNTEDLIRRNNPNVPMLYCTDIDADGRVDIPVTATVAGYEFLTIPEQYFWVDWLYVDEENNFSLTKKFNTYVSLGLEYIFYIPVRWQDFVTVSKTGNTVNFFTYKGIVDGAPYIENILLSVCVASEIPADSEGWELYAQREGGNIYVKSPSPQDPMTLTSDELAMCLSVLNTVQPASASSLQVRR